MSDIAQTDPGVAPRAKGRSDAIEPFIRAHTGGIRRALTRSGLRDEDARDALQDVLSVFARRFSSIEPGAERAFLTATARRVAADYRRKSRAEQSVGEHVDEFAPPVPFEERALDYDLDLRRAHTEVVDALCVLPRVERELFVLGCWQGKSRVEVAAELGIPEGTVASRLRRTKSLFEQARRHLQARPSPLMDGASLPAWAAPGRRRFGVTSMSRPFEELCRGSLVYVNNQWARARASGPFDQCLLIDTAASSIGWSWSWPKRPLSPYAFPHVLHGWSPWSGGAASDGRYPCALRELGRLRVSYEVETQALGHYILLLLVYLLKAPRHDGAPDPCSIATELAVILDHRGDVLASNPVHGRPLIDGVRYRVVRPYSAGAPQLLGYPACVFQPALPRSAGRIDVSNLLRYLVEQRFIDPGLWVAGIELGNEISAGSGTSWLRRFDVELMRSPSATGPARAAGR
jgi:RNA polymerase sigma-70 factor (ECF subfamily)